MRTNSKQKQWITSFKALLLGLVGIIVESTFPVHAAEQIIVRYSPLQLSVPLTTVEAFAQNQEIEPELQLLIQGLTPQEQAVLRELLQAHYNINVDFLQRIVEAESGKKLLRHAGEMVKMQNGENGFSGIETALMTAANDPKGFNLLNFLRAFPSNIQLDVAECFQFVEEISSLWQLTQGVMNQLQQMNTQAATTVSTHLIDPRQSGSSKIQQRTLNLYDTRRDRPLTIDLYLPTQSTTELPVILISNGLGGHRGRFGIVAQHLASHGFAVIIPDHPGSNYARQQDYFLGKYSAEQESFDVSEYIERPRDISYILDELERLNPTEFNGKLNLENVGIFGYSFGGATALALAGAEFNFTELAKSCSSIMSIINISLIYQCRALSLPQKQYKLRDSRIQALFLYVPFNSILFGDQELSKIDIPIFWQATDQDLITPLVLEQIPSYTSLKTADKYLAVTQGIPHTRLSLGLSNWLQKKQADWEDLRQITDTYQTALSLAFFKSYISQETVYKNYLNSVYTQTLSDPEYPIYLVKSISALNETR